MFNQFCPGEPSARFGRKSKRARVCACERSKKSPTALMRDARRVAAYYRGEVTQKRTLFQVIRMRWIIRMKDTMKRNQYRNPRLA